MRIAILETGRPPSPLDADFGTYPQMLTKLLGPGFQFQTFDVRAGPPAGQAEIGDGLLITGSPSGVYDGDPWIDRLRTFLRTTAGTVPIIGVCFGHQILAEALGGRVERAAVGWGVGLHRYEVCAQPDWMDEGSAFALAASHQDQVISLGPGGRRLAGNDFTPIALADYPEHRAMSLQAHPEFEPAFAKALLESRRGRPIPGETVDAALATLDAPHDAGRAAGWMRRFLRSA